MLADRILAGFYEKSIYYMEDMVGRELHEAVVVIRISADQQKTIIDIVNSVLYERTE